MARIESVSVGGYYPTPSDQIPLIAHLLTAQDLPESSSVSGTHGEIAVVDPCAGDGAAVHSLIKSVVDDRQISYYTCELETGRNAALKKRLGKYWRDVERALLGDAFRITFEANKGAGLLFLNPPYDTDRVHGRLEEKFLVRFTPVLTAGGVLVFIVPHYALAASAETLARCYLDVTCWRFAGTAYDEYKQVVLVAKRRDSDAFDADPELVARIHAWASDASSIPDLPATSTGRYTIPANTSYSDTLSEWSMRDLDITALLGKMAPWKETTRARGLTSIARVLPDLPIAELMHRTYEVAMPPRPAHIASGIAAGIFNGQRLDPDDENSNLPPLLVKGVFDREWRTVEEKLNQHGEKISEIQVQQPKLVVTVLDLNTHRYHTVQATVEKSSENLALTGSVVRLGIADLLAHYGTSLMKVMEQQCDILYDPRHDAHKVAVADSPRKPYTAQAHAIRANVTLLRERPGRHPFLLGEIGSGKTTVALLTAKTYGADRILVVCPPHLLDSWKDEVAAVMPEAEYRVVKSISDAEALDRINKPLVAVLSREVAKLGHGWEGVGDTCPRCGLPTPDDIDFAKKRSRCEQRALTPRNEYGRLAHQLALYLRPYAPEETSAVLRSRLDYVRREQLRMNKTEYTGLPKDFLLQLRAKLTFDYVFKNERNDQVKRALVWLHAASPNTDQLTKLLCATQDADDYTHFGESLPLLLAPQSPEFDAASALVGTMPPGKYQYYDRATPDERLEASAKLAADGKKVNVAGVDLQWIDGKLFVEGIEAGSTKAAARALSCVMLLAEWQWSGACGEPLFQAVPEPRRHPLAQFIVNHCKDLFNFLILDEGHEYATEGSAQERAAHRLTTLGMPTILMTGSVMNGYAHSLFMNMWALAPEFREEFGRDESTAFVDRYGYRKRAVQDREGGEVVAFGTKTDRVVRSERDTGVAPGVLPLFLFRHLLPSAVTIHKADLSIDLPLCTQERVEIEPNPELLGEYKELLSGLKQQIKADRFKEGLAGKLFGQLTELPGFLDRCTTDVVGEHYEIRYPESCGGGLVAIGKAFPASTILPKEQWMLDTVERELAEGRNVMVFAWHLDLVPRLQRLIQERIGETVAVLYADKVPTGKRQAWINKEVIKKGRRVMVANPVAIQTGLNNLVYFSTEIWHENPACNPIVYRQAVGRIDRIGQKQASRVLFAHYSNTLQANMYELLLAKVAISTATDGLDPESALRASGIVEDEYLTGLSIGKQLWAMISEDFTTERPRRIFA